MTLPKIAIIRNAESQKIPLPRYGNPIGTSMTLLSAHTDSIKIAPNHYEVIDTGLAIALPVGLEAQVRSLKESTDTGVFVLNGPLTIDASDRKDIKVCLYNASTVSAIIKYKDPIALLVFSPALRVEWDDMTDKRQTQAIQTEAFLERSEKASVQTENESDEFEPVEDEQIEDDTVQEATNEIQSEAPVITNDVVVTETEQENKDLQSSVDSTAVLEEMEQQEQGTYDTEEEKSNEN